MSYDLYLRDPVTKEELEVPPHMMHGVNIPCEVIDGKLYVDQGIIAGCAGGGFENICAAADILKGKDSGNGKDDSCRRGKDPDVCFSLPGLLSLLQIVRMQRHHGCDDTHGLITQKLFSAFFRICAQIRRDRFDRLCSFDHPLIRKNMPDKCFSCMKDSRLKETSFLKNSFRCSTSATIILLLAELSECAETLLK